MLDFGVGIAPLLSLHVQVLYVLYEHATGYAVFQSIAAEDIGSQLDEVQQSMLDLAKFGKVLKLLSFSPFKSGANALENANSVSEGK